MLKYKIKDPDARFWSKVLKTTTCWLWQRGKDKDGYGKFSIRGKDLRAHKYSYMLFNGVYPLNMLVCHTCDTPACVNPKHLFIGSHQDNVNDMISKKRNVYGTKCHNAKYSFKFISQVRNEARVYTQSYLSQKYQISKSTIQGWVSNRNRGIA